MTRFLMVAAAAVAMLVCTTADAQAFGKRGGRHGGCSSGCGGASVSGCAGGCPTVAVGGCNSGCTTFGGGYGGTPIVYGQPTYGGNIEIRPGTQPGTQVQPGVPDTITINGVTYVRQR